MITGTSISVGELRHVINHTAPVVAHNGHVNNLVQRIQRGATVGARLSPPRVHSRTAGPAQQTSTTLINVLQLEKRDGNQTEGICICATTGITTTGPSTNTTSCTVGSRLSPTTAHNQLNLHKNIDHLVKCTATGEELMVC